MLKKSSLAFEKFIFALIICLSFLNLSFKFILSKLKNKENNLEKICKQEELLYQFEKEIDFYNKSFAQWEKIKKFKLTPEVWSIEKEHLTHTMKVKRKLIKEKFKELVNEIYN